MRFSLQDVKKSVQRRKGELSLSLHLLRSGELTHEIAELIDYHERLLNQPQRLFSQDEARAYIGDYRLAHCLIATLSYWYSWQHPSWQETLLRLSTHPDISSVVSSTQLRLELYNYVNEHYQGFLDSGSRENALRDFAGQYALPLADLEYLLVLDSDEEARLTRNALEPPSPQEVATRYNQWAFEAALGSASSVHFTIDCNAFASMSGEEKDVTASSTGTLTTGVGVAIKRLCYLARTIGVYYDLAYEDSLDKQHPLLSLTLYGPQEVTGVPQQYGLRLARLCRALLGYTKIGDRQKKSQLINAILDASAVVHMSQRTYAFHMNPEMLRLLPSEREPQNTTQMPETSQTLLFDSRIEQSFAEAFAALERSHAVDEWRLEREPEPLLLEQSIFIPDFALTRAQHRIYVEILGFWTPAYRERKVQKLQQLRSRNDILLAIPISAKDAYTSILTDFPVVFYEQQLSASDILYILRTTYDDFATRLASIDTDAVRAHVRQGGLLPEQSCFDVLHCYRRTEVQQAVTLVENAEIAFMPGVGLYTHMWYADTKKLFLEWMQGVEQTSLYSALEHLRKCDAVLPSCGDEVLEILIESWSEFQINRDSIFNATLQLVHVGVPLDDVRSLQEHMGYSSGDTETTLSTSQNAVKPPESKRERRSATHAGKRKRLVKESPETTQEHLWDN